MSESDHAFRWCSSPGCQREAAGSDTLCGHHRAGRKRSTAAIRPMHLPGTDTAPIRAAALSDVLRQMSTIDASCTGAELRWSALRDYLLSELDKVTA